MPKTRLFTPGPTPVPDQVQLDIAQRMDHHRTEEFRSLLAETTAGLKTIFATEGDVLTFTSSGTGAMEGAIVCTAQPGKKALTYSGGKFGQRWGKVCDAFGIEHIDVEVEWGCGVDPADVEKRLADDPDIGQVIVVHCETSTAAATNIEAIGKVVAKTDALFLVDAISSAGALPIKADAWNIDVVVTGSQKALMMPPGLAFAAVSDKAWKVIDSVKPKAFYFDYRAYRKSMQKNDTPYTPALTLIRGLRRALAMINDEGIDNVYARTAKLAQAMREAFVAMGLKLFARDPSDSVTAAYLPDGVDDGAFRTMLLDDYGVRVAGGQDHLKGKVFRITHMGDVDHVDMLGGIGAIEATLMRLGYKLEPGTGLAAAQKVLTAQ